METSNLSNPSGNATTPRMAYERMKEEIASVPLEQVVHINVDIPTAVTSALRSLPGLQALRPELAKLAGFDLESFDKLELYTLAAFHGNTVYGMALRPAESMPELVAEATRLRDMLYSDALALAHRDMLEVEAIRSVKTSIGYRPLANDLGALATLFLESWEKLKGKCAVAEADLALADSLSHRILNAVAMKEQLPSSAVAQASLNRQRAYSLFFRAYDSARRGVAYLRWHDNDVETIAPSLFAGRTAGKGKRVEEQDPPAEEPSAPLPTAPLPGSQPSLPVGIVPVPAPGVSSSAPIPVGMPGADPYVRS